MLIRVKVSCPPSLETECYESGADRKRTVKANLTDVTSGKVTALEAVPSVNQTITMAGTEAYSANSYSTVYLVTLIFSGLALVFCMDAKH